MSVNGSGDAGVCDLELGIVDLCLIGLHHPFKLADQCLLGIELLFGNIAILQQSTVAFEVELGIFQLRPVARHLSLDL